MKKRIVSLVLAVATVLGISGAACAVEPRASYTLDSYYVSLIPKGNGKMAVAVVVNGVGEQEKIGVQEVWIDHKTNASDSWTYYDSLFGAEHPEFYVYDDYLYADEIYFDGVPGEIYRVTITAYAEKGDKWDTGYVTSPSATCK